MDVNSSQINTLLRTADLYKTPREHDLITGADTQLPDALLSEVPSTPDPGLSKTQLSTLNTLNSFIADNIEGSEADKLQADIAALKELSSFGNENSKTKVDPVFSLLSSSETLRDSMKPGTLINELL